MLKKSKQKNEALNVSINTTEEDNALECPKCKKTIKNDSRFCSHCGQNIELAKNEPKGAKKNAKSTIKELKRIYGDSLCESTNDLTGLQYAFQSGIFQTSDGRFSRTLEFSDISYVNERKDVQTDIFEKFCSLHAYFPPKSIYQINLISFPVSLEKEKKYLAEEGADAQLAKDFNRILEKRSREGNMGFEKKSYLSFSLASESLEEAEGLLASIRSGVQSIFGSLNSKCSELGGTERLHLLHRLLRGEKEPFLFSYDQLEKNKRSARDFIAPSWAAYRSEDLFLREGLQLPHAYVKTFQIRDFGSDLSDRAIRQIRGLSIPMNISLLFKPQIKHKMVSKIRENISVVQGEIYDYQTRASRAGADMTILPPALENKESEGREVLDFVLEKDQNISYFQGLITIYADSPEQMKKYERALRDEASTWTIDLVSLPEMQEQALTAALPLATTTLNKRFRSLTTAEGAIMIPFASQNIHDDPKTSYLLGQDPVTLQNILVNPFTLNSPHLFLFGITGAGKGMFINSLVTYLLLQHPRTTYNAKTKSMVSQDQNTPQVFFIDVHSEYSELTKLFDGVVEKFGPGHEACLNPLAIANQNGVLNKRLIAQNNDYFIALSQEIMGRALSPQEQSIIDEVAYSVFKPHFDKETRPTLGEFYEVLREDDRTLAQNLADAYQLFATGTMNSMNGQTNFEDSPYLTNYDLSELGKTMETITIISILQHVRQATYANYAKGRRTVLVLEEVQKLFDNNAAVAILDSMFSEMRKFGLCIIAVTQLPDRVLNHYRAQYLFKNTGLFVLLAQNEEVQDLCAQTFKLSKTQRDRIGLNVEKGSGLVIADGVKIAMSNTIPRDNPLYEIWNTDPDRLVAQALEGTLDDLSSEQAEQIIKIVHGSSSHEEAKTRLIDFFSSNNENPSELSD